MKISIIGLGYVGVVCSACFVKMGHEVFGVDVDINKVDAINAGQAPIFEQDLAELIESGVQAGRLKATTDHHRAVLETEVSFVCVGTPSQASGEPDLMFVCNVIHQLGVSLREKSGNHLVVMRSTVLPGTAAETVIPLLQKTSGKALNSGFMYASNPEFLREGSAIDDFFNPPKIVIGESCAQAGDMLSGLYTEIQASLVRCDIATSEMVKFADNAWHAVKVTFANEMGNIAKASGIDGRKVMDIFCQDTKLNISTQYLKPGFAFGGSCLPKDVRALVFQSDKLQLRLPLLTNIIKSNLYQIDHALRLIQKTGHKHVALLGLSFKPNTDDVREAPQLMLAERLLGKGYTLYIYDKIIHARVHHATTDQHLDARISHLAPRIFDDLTQVLEEASVIVICNADSAFMHLCERITDKPVIDLVGITGASEQANYEGICW